VKGALTETTILIVDDEDDLRESIVQYFKKRNYRVFEAANTQEALHLLQTQTVDILINDILMPDNAQTDLVSHIRKASASEIKIILISGQLDFDPQKGKQWGADHFLMKPFLPSDLLSLVNQCLSSTSKAA
jgi:DNA-binding response OmpR family regulator